MIKEKKLDRVYIFVSHSHKDIEKVRVIRNYLESLGGEPLLFFLLSKDDDNEIDKLIKDEISARIWFIYIESGNSKQSKWVQTELEFARNYPKTNILTINLDQSFIDGTLELTDEAKNLLRTSLLKMRLLKEIYFSYADKDYEIMERIIQTFEKYQIFFIDSHQTTDINCINEKKFFVQFVKKDYDSFLNDELSKALAKKIDNEVDFSLFFVLLDSDASSISNIINEIELPCSKLAFRRRTYFYLFDTNNMEKSCDELIRLMYMEGFKQYE